MINHTIVPDRHKMWDMVIALQEITWLWLNVYIARRHSEWFLIFGYDRTYICHDVLINHAINVSAHGDRRNYIMIRIISYKIIVDSDY